MENISNTKTDQMIKEDERIDDLQRNHYRIIQKKKWFLFWYGCCFVIRFCSNKARGTDD